MLAAQYCLNTKYRNHKKEESYLFICLLNKAFKILESSESEPTIMYDQTKSKSIKLFYDKKLLQNRIQKPLEKQRVFCNQYRRPRHWIGYMPDDVVLCS